MTTADERLQTARTFRDDLSTTRTSPSERDEPVVRLWHKIERAFDAHRGREELMDADMKRHLMTPWTPEAGSPIKPKHAYTSNRDGVLSRKVSYVLASSKTLIRIPNERATGQRVQVNDRAERLAIGMLNLGNDLLTARGEPPVLYQMAGLVPVRGEIAVCRYLLDKGEKGETVVDILPIDARNFVFSRSRHGVRWCCHRFERTVAEIRETYPDFRFPGEEFGDSKGEDSDLTDTKIVYDYYESRKGRCLNAVLIEEQFAKRLTDTNAELWPVIITAVGYMPPLVGGKSTEEERFAAGESVFAMVRNITPFVNEAVSLALAAADQQVDRAYKVFSQDGDVTYKRSPLAAGTGTPLSKLAGEDVQTYQPADIGNAPVFAASVIQTEWDGGGVSPLTRGQYPPGASGVAMRLTGSNLEERAHPFKDAIASNLRAGLDALLAQYETGLYKPLTVYGRTSSNVRFADLEIAPETIAGRGRLTVELAIQLPQDDQMQAATAQMLAKPVAPGMRALLDVQTVREERLGIQDSAVIDERQDMEEATAAAPRLKLEKLFESAIERGEMSAAEYLWEKIQEVKATDWMSRMVLTWKIAQIMQAGSAEELMQVLGGGPQAQRTNGAGGGGIPGEVSSVENAVPGTTGASPSPQAGMNAGVPRPGGQGDERQRLAAIGLEYAR